MLSRMSSAGSTGAHSLPPASLLGPWPGSVMDSGCVTYSVLLRQRGLPGVGHWQCLEPSLMVTAGARLAPGGRGMALFYALRCQDSPPTENPLPTVSAAELSSRPRGGAGRPSSRSWSWAGPALPAPHPQWWCTKVLHPRSDGQGGQGVPCPSPSPSPPLQSETDPLEESGGPAGRPVAERGP